jgi:hypothetical protein
MTDFTLVRGPLDILRLPPSSIKLHYLPKLNLAFTKKCSNNFILKKVQPSLTIREFNDGGKFLPSCSNLLRSCSLPISTRGYMCRAQPGGRALVLWRNCTNIRLCPGGMGWSRPLLRDHKSKLYAHTHTILLHIGQHTCH